VKRVAVVISVLLVVSLVGAVMTRAGGDDSNATVVDSVPAGDPHAELPVSSTAPSPEHAAAGAVAMTGDVVTAGLISRRELIESFTTADFGPELADLTSEQVTAMQLSMTETGRSSAGLSVAEFPLRLRAVTRDANSAVVEVWSVLVIASADEPVARQSWRTVTVDLELVDGRWLVDGWQSVEGPSPAAAPEGAVASGQDVADRLQWLEVE
jgi:hypothetical protein